MLDVGLTGDNVKVEIIDTGINQELIALIHTNLHLQCCWREWWSNIWQSDIFIFLESNRIKDEKYDKYLEIRGERN